MKGMKKLIPALCLLLVSAILMGTSTYAWFSMNTSVTATNMQVKAVADQGILINEEATANSASWDNQATNTYGTGLAPILLHATSTTNTGTWYSAHSKVQSDAAANTSAQASANLTAEGYKTVSTAAASASNINATLQQVTAASAGVTAKQEVFYSDSDNDGNYDNGEGYYAKFTYYLKSSAEQISTGIASGNKNLTITVDVDDGTPATEDLDKALRVAVVIDGKAYIFAPLYNADQTYYVSTSRTSATAYTGTQNTAALTIPDTNTNGKEVNVYIYYEGEDTNLKTSNVIAEIDTLNVTVTFAITDLTAAATPHGVAIS